MVDLKDLWPEPISKAVEGQRCRHCNQGLDLTNVEAVGLRRLKSPDKTQSVPLGFTILICPHCHKTTWLDVWIRRGAWTSTAMLAWVEWYNYKPNAAVAKEA